MDRTIRIHFMRGVVIVAGVLGLSAITSTFVASRAYERRARIAKVQEQTISVKGSSRLRISSDLATWRIDIRGDGPTIAGAYEVLDIGSRAANDFLAAKGFASSAVRAEPVLTQEVTHRDAHGVESLVGYTLTRTLVVVTTEVSRVDATAGDITELLKSGFYVVSHPPAYTYTKIADLKVQILGEASKDARARAEEIISHAGGRVGELRSASMGVLNITVPNSTDVSSSGIDDTSTIDKDIRGVVTLTFAVDSR